MNTPVRKIKAYHNNNFKSLVKTRHSIKQIVLRSKCNDYADKLLSNPPTINLLLRFVNNFVTGIIFTILLRVLNNFKVYGKSILFKRVFNRDPNIGLLTVSNHQSLLDDPGLWAAILPFWRLNPNLLRWSLCTEDNFFAVITDMICN